MTELHSAVVIMVIFKYPISGSNGFTPPINLSCLHSRHKQKTMRVKEISINV